MRRVTVDLVSHSPSKDAFVLHLVEQGPWRRSSWTAKLRKLQARLYSTVDAVVDGHVSERFPESRGQAFVIQVDCYDVPEPEVRPFFERFASFIRESPEYRNAVGGSPFLASLAFEIHFDTIKRGGVQGS